MDGIQRCIAFTAGRTKGADDPIYKEELRNAQPVPIEISPLERTPEADIVEISGKNNTENSKKEASTSKKWGVGIASTFIPGLGQAINGDWGKAAGFFLGNATFNILAFSNPLLFIPAAAINICSIVDAVKSAKAD